MSGFKKKFVVGALAVAVLFSASACNPFKSSDSNLSSSGSSSSSTSSVKKELDESFFPKIAEHFQTKSPSALDDIPADFFSSHANYTNFISLDVRTVNLSNTKSIKIAVDDNVHSTVKSELNNAVAFLNSYFKTINSSFNFYITNDSPNIFNKRNSDTIFVRPVSSDYQKQNFDGTNIVASTELSNQHQPYIFMNLAQANKYVFDGKRISLQHALVHELLHGCDINHSPNTGDIMYAALPNFKNVKNYSSFSDNETRAFINSFASSKSFEEKYEIYKKITNAPIAQPISAVFNEYMKKFDSYSQSQLDDAFGTAKHADIIKSNQIIALLSMNGRNTIVLNAERLGYYVVKENSNFLARGRFFIYNVPQNSNIKAKQIFFLENYPLSFNSDGSVATSKNFLFVNSHETIQIGQKSYASRWHQVGSFSNMQNTAAHFVNTTSSVVEKIQDGSFFDVNYPYSKSASASAQSDEIANVDFVVSSELLDSVEQIAIAPNLLYFPQINVVRYSTNKPAPLASSQSHNSFIDDLSF